MLVMDSVGLGIFTVVGVNTGIRQGFADNTFLLVFVGTITGVGGGLLRDMMAERTNGKLVILENDANAAAYGEYQAGALAGADNALAITLGTGVGGGIILNEKI